MADREKILKGLEHHRHLEASRNELGHDECFDCPYRPYGEDTCASLDRMIDDALELLKEQEPVEPIKLENWWKCPSCGGNIVYNMKHCPGCGRKVKWK